MTEQKGKGSRLVDELMAKPITPEEIERQRGPRPRLRIRPEALARALGSDATVRDVLGRQTGDAGDTVTVLRDPKTGATAVAVPLEQYLELATSSIRDERPWVAGLDGGMRPPDAALTELGVEQANPEDSWIEIHRQV